MALITVRISRRARWTDREPSRVHSVPMTPSFASPNSSPQAGSAGRREVVREAVDVLAAEGCVAFPSETIWGLAASAGSPAAVAALGAWKGRADGQPISVLVSGESALRGYGFELGSLALSLMEHFWPGPLTLVLACRSAFAPGIAREDGSVGVRCSSHPVAAELVAAAEASGLGPLTATSCNRSGAPPARTESEARTLCSASASGKPGRRSQGADNRAGPDGSTASNPPGRGR